MNKFITTLLVAVACQGACSHLENVPPDRPVRVGVINMSPELDDIKPVAEADYTGWLETSSVLVGSTDNRWAMGFSLETKKTLWWLEGKADVAGPMSAFGNWVVIGFRDGTFMKVDALTGKKAWEISLDSFSARKAALAKGRLLVMTTSQQLYGIDFETGSTQWLYDGGYPDGLHLNGAADPVSDGKLVLIGLANGSLHAVELQSGRRAWVYEGGVSGQRFHDVMGQIVVRGSDVTFARYDGTVQSVDFSGITRQTNWELKLPAVTSTALHNGRYYVGCLNGEVHAIEVKSGKKLWVTPTGQAVSSITPSESTVYVGGTNGRIHSLNILDGDPRWHDDLNAEVNTAPVVIDGNLYFATGYKNLYGYKIF